MSNISEIATNFEQTTQKAVKWLETNGPAKAARKMRAYGREAKRLARTAKRPQAFAVYGESQAGKSYLMGELSAPEKGIFTVTWPGQKPVNFIGEEGINPQNNGESSGLVSRFTTQPLPLSPDASLPVPVGMLCPTDVVSIIGNAFFSDFELKDNYQNLETEIMGSLAALEPDTEAGLLGINEIETLEEYFNNKFASNAQFVPFKKPDYWNWLKKNASRLSLAKLVQALSPLWRKIPSLTTYAYELLSSLEQMGAPESAFCGMDALIPASESILNVKMLSEPGGVIRMVTPSGKSVSIQRSIASALVSELVIPLSHPRWEFQATTDLLDFPGGRTREIFKTPEDGAGKEGLLFLRGKVDYLFQLYQDNMETTSTLLCVGEGNQNVKSVPRMIESWVEHTIGASPTERQGKDTALFFILTKFDTSLKEGDVIAANSTARWDTRLDASLVQPYGDLEWMREWTPGKTFNNTYWLRAPRFGLAYKKDAQGHELPGQYAESLVHRIDEIHDAHNRSEKVRKYFSNPEEAFNAVMQPNDGGITYLAKNLQRLSANKAKDTQVRAALGKCLHQAEHLAKTFYHDASAAEEEKKAKADAKVFISTSILPMQAQGRYGRFLERLIPTTSDIAAEWRTFNTEISTAQNISQLQEAEDQQLLASLFEDDDEPDAAPQADALKPLDQDRFTRFADRILTYWREQTLKTLLSDTPEAQIERQYFSLTCDTLKPFLEQLWHLQEHGHFATRLAGKLREQCGHESPLIQKGDKPAIICAEMLGSFISCMGYSLLPASAVHDDRPLSSLTRKPVFIVPDEPALYPDIQDDADGGKTWMVDWCKALIARFSELGPSFDVTANEALGKIIVDYTQIESDFSQTMTPLSNV